MHLIIVIILIVFIQVQPNGKDCGLFAVAFALAICCGQAPEELYFHVQQMRGDLVLLPHFKQDEVIPLRRNVILKTETNEEMTQWLFSASADSWRVKRWSVVSPATRGTMTHVSWYQNKCGP